LLEEKRKIFVEYNPQWNPYSDIIVNHVFDCITPNSRVLEVGPFDGWFSDLILQKSPSYLELVEPNVYAFDRLTEKYKNNTAVSVNRADIFDIIKTYSVQSFDVVVAFGVLYHWHSPLEFLEQVSNLLDPTYFCIDNVGAKYIYISDEELNIGGSRNIVDTKKTANLSLALPGDIISKAMTNLGYEEKFYRSMSDIQLPTKENFNVWKFQKS
jgi:SAM-dependent methyltransferase